MDLRRLSHFIALAEEGRFAPAANRAHLSQAAFSRSIQALEEQAGMTLVDRGPHGITLTQAGEVVLRRARELVFDSSCLVRDLALMKAGDAGELIIGAGPVPAATIVPSLLVKLRRQSPHIVNRLRFGKLPQLLTQLDAQEIDVCLGDPRQMLRNEHYAMARVGKQFGGMYCRAGHPLLRKGEVNAESLSRYGIALISTSASLMDSLASDYGFASGAQVPLAVECDDISMLSRLIAETDILGLFLMPSSTKTGPDCASSKHRPLPLYLPTSTPSGSRTVPSPPPPNAPSGLPGKSVPRWTALRICRNAPAHRRGGLNLHRVTGHAAHSSQSKCTYACLYCC